MGSTGIVSMVGAGVGAAVVGAGVTGARVVGAGVIGAGVTGAGVGLGLPPLSLSGTVSCIVGGLVLIVGGLVAMIVGGLVRIVGRLVGGGGFGTGASMHIASR